MKIKSPGVQAAGLILSILFCVLVIIYMDTILGFFPSPYIKFLFFLLLISSINPVAVILQSDRYFTIFEMIKLYLRESIEMIMIVVMHLFMIPVIAVSMLYIMIGMLSIVIVLCILFWFFQYGTGVHLLSGLRRSDLLFYATGFNFAVILTGTGYAVNKWMKKNDYSFMGLYDYVEKPVMEFIAGFLSTDKDKSARKTYKK